MQSRVVQPEGLQHVLLARAPGKFDGPPAIFWAGYILELNAAHTNSVCHLHCHPHFSREHEKQNDQGLSHGHFPPPKETKLLLSLYHCARNQTREWHRSRGPRRVPTPRLLDSVGCLRSRRKMVALPSSSIAASAGDAGPREKMGKLREGRGIQGMPGSATHSAQE